MQAPFGRGYQQGVTQIIERGHRGILSEPANIRGDLWIIILECWKMDASTRPTMSEVDDMLTWWVVKDNR